MLSRFEGSNPFLPASRSSFSLPFSSFDVLRRWCEPFCALWRGRVETPNRGDAEPPSRRAAETGTLPFVSQRQSLVAACSVRLAVVIRSGEAAVGPLVLPLEGWSSVADQAFRHGFGGLGCVADCPASVRARGARDRSFAIWRSRAPLPSPMESSVAGSAIRPNHEASDQRGTGP